MSSSSLRDYHNNKDESDPLFYNSRPLHTKHEENQNNIYSGRKL